MRSTLFCILLFSISAFVQVAQAEIHRCPQPDGTVAFQETPCPEPAAEDDADERNNTAAEETPPDDFFDFVNPYDEPQTPPETASVEPVLPEPISQDRELCEKTTRDAIDAIDLEMRQASYTKEEGDAYLARLLELTEQLRACKRL